jgi:hypothetical protein
MLGARVRVEWFGDDASLQQKTGEDSAESYLWSEILSPSIVR